MAEPLRRDVLFTGLTRPQMFAGVTYTFFVLNGIATAELFIIFKSLAVFAIAGLIHLTGVIACLREPRIFDLWIKRVSRCPRVRNYAVWQCNSYRP